MSDSVRPYGQQSTRLLCPQDSLDKNTGVGEKDLESPSSTSLEDLVPSRDSRARTRSPSPRACPQPGGRAPRSGEAWITAGSQAPSQDQGGGAEGVLLLQTLSGLSEAINSPGLSPRALANPWGRWETTRAARTPISLLWLKHCSSSFAIAHITRSLFYKCRGPDFSQAR